MAKDAEEGAIKGATTGAILGTIAGLVVANGVLPGLGTLFVAGPLLIETFGLTVAAATTLGGAVTGAIAGGLIGGLAKLGVPNEDAYMYQGSLERGSALVITRTESPVAKSILLKNGAIEVKEYRG